MNQSIERTSKNIVLVCLLYILHSDSFFFVFVFLYFSLFSFYLNLSIIHTSFIVLCFVFLPHCDKLFRVYSFYCLFICNIFFSHGLRLFVRYITYKNQKVITFESSKRKSNVFFFFLLLFVI
jgi:hypothetical protein